MEKQPKEPELDLDREVVIKACNIPGTAEWYADREAFEKRAETRVLREEVEMLQELIEDQNPRRG